MHNATLLLTRPNKSSAHDDRVVISQTPECPDMFRVTYTSPEFKNTREFITSYSSALNYVEDILVSLQYDVEPFEHVQSYTAIHPAVLYHSVDMSDCCVRRIILNQFRDALRFNVSFESE